VRHLRGAIRSIRAAGHRWVLPFVVGSSIVAVMVQTSIAIPLSRATSLLWPLACVSAVPSGVWLLAVGGRWLEGAAGLGRAYRAGLTGTVLAAVGVPVAVASFAIGSAAHAPEIVRNFTFVLGLTLVGRRALGRAELAWLPPFAVVVICWLVGSAPPGVPPERWAIILQPWTNTAATSAALVIAVLGVVDYVFLSGPTC
jgi:hypothetical protein